MIPVNARPRAREPASGRQNLVGPQRRRAHRHPASPLREPDILGPNESEPGVTGTRLPGLAPPFDRLWRQGDVFVSVNQITVRKVGPACYADPGGLDDTLRRRTSVRDSQATRGEILPVVSQVHAESLGQAAR